jgi:hypothetical protein
VVLPLGLYKSCLPRPKWPLFGAGAMTGFYPAPTLILRSTKNKHSFLSKTCAYTKQQNNKVGAGLAAKP